MPPFDYSLLSSPVTAQGLQFIPQQAATTVPTVGLLGSQFPAGNIAPGNAGNGIQLPMANGAGNTSFLGNGSGFGFNIPTLQLGLQGLGSLANLWMGMKSLNLAKDQFDFTKQTTNTNLNNQIKAYNTGLEDRLRTREQFNTGASSDAWKADFERLKATR